MKVFSYVLKAALCVHNVSVFQLRHSEWEKNETERALQWFRPCFRVPPTGKKCAIHQRQCHHPSMEVCVTLISWCTHNIHVLECPIFAKAATHSSVCMYWILNKSSTISCTDWLSIHNVNALRRTKISTRETRKYVSPEWYFFQVASTMSPLLITVDMSVIEFCLDIGWKSKNTTMSCSCAKQQPLKITHFQISTALATIQA